MYEELRDNILRLLKNGAPGQVFNTLDLARALNQDFNDLSIAALMLKNDDLIVHHANPLPIEGYNYSDAAIKIKHKGIAFITDTSFVEQQKKALAKDEMLNYESRLIKLEIREKKWFWLPVAISILSLAIAVVAILVELKKK